MDLLCTGYYTDEKEKKNCDLHLQSFHAFQQEQGLYLPDIAHDFHHRDSPDVSPAPTFCLGIVVTAINIKHALSQKSSTLLNIYVAN